jgi:O-acetyl-ADP-ribose deacetylase (regulator of RNase III)
MIYKEEIRNLFFVPEDYYLAHCISADFGMGKGIVVEFNKRFDLKKKLQSRYPDYISQYNHHRIGGDCILEGRVLNLITKERYFHKPTIITMRLALQKMKKLCIDNNITKIAMPTIGAGLDRLAWSNVSEQIKQIFDDTGIEILVCKLK